MMYVKLLFLNEYFEFLFLLQLQKLEAIEKKYEVSFSDASAAVDVAQEEDKSAEEIQQLMKFKVDQQFKYVSTGLSAERTLGQRDVVLKRD